MPMPIQLAAKKTAPTGEEEGSDSFYRAGDLGILKDKKILVITFSEDWVTPNFEYLPDDFGQVHIGHICVVQEVRLLSK